eukprot:229575-Amphidinium_carterae.1
MLAPPGDMSHVHEQRTNIVKPEWRDYRNNTKYCLARLYYGQLPFPCISAYIGDFVGHALVKPKEGEVILESLHV